MMAAMGLLVACSSDGNEATGEGMVPINLTISPKTVSTRTATTDIQSAQLASGQTFYAYFTSADVVPRSTTFTADGAGGTTPASQPYFKLSETSTGVRAYYPSSVTEATTSFTVEANQSGDDAYRASDLMFASSNITKVFPASTGALTFAHKMAKIKVTTTTRVSSIKTIKLKGILPTVPFNASDGTLGTASGSATDITMYSHSGQTANINCVALIPPQSKAADATLIEVTSALHSSTPLTYKLPNAITFQSGLQYIFNVDLHEEQLVVTCTVAAWGAGNTNSAAVDVRFKLPIEYVAPYNMAATSSDLSSNIYVATTHKMASDNTPQTSAYFRWNSALKFQKHVAVNNSDGSFSGFYHLPTAKEWMTVIAPWFTANTSEDDNVAEIFPNISGSKGDRIYYSQHSAPKTGLKEEVEWGAHWNGTSYDYLVSGDAGIFYADYYCPTGSGAKGYGLRFKPTASANGVYTCAYRYEYKTTDVTVGNAPSLTVMVKYVGPDPNVTINTISTESYWATCDYILVLPVCGHKGIEGKDYPSGTYVTSSSVTSPANGHYWSSTQRANGNSFYISFYTTHVQGNTSYTPNLSSSVRLFKDRTLEGDDPGVALSSSAIQIGWVVAENGKVYQTLALANQFSTAVAMVAYIGSASDCSHGLAYALTDMGPMYRAAAATSVNGYTPVVAGGSWRLPTKTDYKYMFAACGGSPIGTADGASQSYNYGNFRTLLQGVNADVLNVRYWTSTAQASDLLWDYDFSGKYFYYNDIHNGYVRAVLAF